MTPPSAHATRGTPPSRDAKSDVEAWLLTFLKDTRFLESYPYYAAVLAALSPVADPSVSRMAVSLVGGRFFLHINVDSFVAEPQFLRGVLLHEVHHVVLGHLTHPKFEEVRERELMDLAVEMSANEYIDEPLPNPITWRMYADAGIRAGQSTMQRYEKLVAYAEERGQRPRPAGGKTGEAVDDHRFLRKGAAHPGGVAQTALLVLRASETVPFPREEVLGIPPRHTLAGRTPRRLVEELAGVSDRPEQEIDWQSALAMFAARARGPMHTWSRPNRRFPTRVFEVPGRTWTTRRSAEPRLLVAIDTSLSMTRAELEEVARHLTVLAGKAHITIAECDREITRIYPFSGALDRVEGRGGTDLCPVFERGLLVALGVSGIVYFTDGDGPFPEEPASLPTLWILTKPSEFRCPWGERARLVRETRRS